MRYEMINKNKNFNAVGVSSPARQPDNEKAAPVGGPFSQFRRNLVGSSLKGTQTRMNPNHAAIFCGKLNGVATELIHGSPF
jgi:hypothetical protein